jgi:hypothetical protein
MKIHEAMAPRRAISKEEIETYSRDGVVCLRGVLSRDSIKSIEDAIEAATASLDQSYGGYNLTAIVDAIARDDQATLKAQSGKQYNVEALGQAIKASGKPLLRESPGEAPKRNGSFLLDSGVAAKNMNFRAFALLGECPEIAAALLQSRKINFYDDQIFVKQPKTSERTAYHRTAPTSISKGIRPAPCGSRSIR